MAIDEARLNAFMGQFVQDMHEVVTRGGFSSFRRASETPFNLVYEARP